MAEMPNSKLPTSCRLCGGGTRYVFSKTVLAKYEVQYFQCQQCDSQQTEYPYWLEEAYSIEGLHIDVGAPTRCLKNWLATTVLLDLLEIPLSAKGVDFGAGPGMFVGLMRSIGRDFTSFDAFTKPVFSSYSSIDSMESETPQIITAFEVFEHLPEPNKTLNHLLSFQAPLIIFTTWHLDDQSEDWVYYLPDCGQHIFFYSRRAMEEHARSFGYKMLVSQYFFILYLPEMLSPQQIMSIENFSLHSIDLLESRVSEIVLSVIMGNRYIEGEFENALERFQSELLQKL